MRRDMGRSGRPAVVLVGAGNLAWSLLPAMAFNHSYRLSILVRNEEKVEIFRDCFPDVQIIRSLSEIEVNAGILLAVPDDDLPGVAAAIDSLAISPSWIAHCSGSQPLEVLSAFGSRAAVLYPLQTFTRLNPILWSDVPVFAEGSNSDFFDFLKKISPKYHHLSSADRLRLHLAAVWASNFTNALLGVAAGQLPEGLELNVLEPLIMSQVRKALTLGPAVAQTGPARRQDVATLTRHLDLLRNQPPLSDLYRKLSQLISPEIHFPAQEPNEGSDR